MATSTTSADVMYQLRGLNMITPDQIIDDTRKTEGQSPYTINSRVFLPQSTSDPRTSIQERKGAGFYTIPVGETLSTQNTTTTGQSNQDVSYLTRVAQRFTAGATKRLTAIDMLMKYNTSNDTVIVAIYSDVSGNLGTRLAISSLRRNDQIITYSYIKVRFPQAPLLTNATNYWIVVYTQEEALTGSSHLSRTTTGANLMVSTDAGTSYSATTGSINFKTYLSDDGTIKGVWRRVQNNGTKETLFAHGTSLYRVTNESTGAIEAILTGLNASAKRYRFADLSGITYVVNGYDNIIKYSGGGAPGITRVVNDPVLFPIPENIKLWKNRVFYYNRDNPTRVYFSELAPAYDTIPNVNFFYVPEPTSPDPITGWETFQDQLVIFTKESKWLAVGDGSIGGTSLNQSPGGTKGAVSQESISRGETRIFFWSIDGGGHYYDGARDVPITDPIQPEVGNMVELDSIDAIVTDREWRIYYKPLGSSNHSRMLLRDLRYNEWLMDTETYTRLPISWSLENNELVEASSVVGALYFGEVDDSHLGSPIDFKYWTNYKKYTSGIAKDRVRTFRTIFKAPDRTISVLVGKDSDFDNDPNMKTVVLTASGILYDGGEVYGSPTAIYSKGSRVSQPKVSLSGRALNTQYRFEKYGAHTPVAIYGYESIVKSGRPR